MDSIYGAAGEDRPRSTTRKEAPLGPRQPDRQVCAGCGDGVAQSIGNFPVIRGGGRSPLCKLHQPEAWPAVVQAWRAADSAPPATPFQATDADIDYLDTVGPPRTVRHGVIEAPPAGVVVDSGGYEPALPPHLMRRSQVAADIADAEAFARVYGIEAAQKALPAVPVAAGTIELLTRNANADRMVAALGSLVAQLEALPAKVTNDKEQGTVALLLTRAAEEEKNIEALRETIKAPYLAACKTIDGAMGTGSLARKQLGIARVRISKALGAYQDHRASVAAREAEEARLRAVQAAEAEAAAMAQAAAATTKDERHRALAAADAASMAQVHATIDAQDAEAPVKGVRTEAGTLGFTAPWQVEVVDEALVPREYLMVDLAMLRRVVKDGGRRTIPGCNIYRGHGLRIGK